MATIKSVEESEAFREARCLVKTVYDLTKESPFSKDFGLVDQIRRSAVSVLSNISEGFERDGSSEFIQFLSIAKGSVGEVKAQLVVALDQGYITADQNLKASGECIRTAKLIAGWMKYLRGSEHKGVKFRRER